MQDNEGTGASDYGRKEYERPRAGTADRGGHIQTVPAGARKESTQGYLRIAAGRKKGIRTTITQEHGYSEAQETRRSEEKRQSRL